MITTTYKFRLYPTPEQKQLLKQHAGNVRYTWNQLVSFVYAYNKEHSYYPNQSTLQKEIINLKEEHDFLLLSHSQPLQINAQRLERTIKIAFKPETVKKRKQAIAKAHKIEDPKRRSKKLDTAHNLGFPKYHKKSDNTDAIYYPQNVKVIKCKVFLPKLGWINFKKHRSIEGKIKTGTVVQDGDQWFICLVCYVNREPPALVPLDKADIQGIDLNMRDNFATLSDDEVIENPKFLKKSLEKLEIENKKLSRKKKTEVTLPDGRKIKKYSKRGEKQCLKVHKVHQKIRNQRLNFLHQKSYHIITTHDGICAETLSIKDMLSGEISNINRAISDVSWGTFVLFLEYKAKKHGKYFVKIDRFIPTTQTCNKCKHTMKLSIDQREYVCEVCGHREGRDNNSAKNVRDEGLKLLYKKYGSTAGTAGRDARTLSDGNDSCTISTGTPLL